MCQKKLKNKTAEIEAILNGYSVHTSLYELVYQANKQKYANEPMEIVLKNKQQQYTHQSKTVRKQNRTHLRYYLFIFICLFMYLFTFISSFIFNTVHTV